MTAPTFTTTRLNPTTFAITMPTHPPTYLKRFSEPHILLHAGHPHPAIATYLETVPVSANGNRPLNPRGAHEYILTLLRLPHTAASTKLMPSMILASSNAAPPYPPLPVEHLEDTAMFPHVSLSETPLTALLTPGVAPESLCVYDAGEAVLFAEELVGAVVFGLQSEVSEYWRSLERVLEFLRDEADEGTAVIAGGVVRVDAVEVVEGMKELLGRVLRGEVKGAERGGGRGGRVLFYGGKEASFLGPECVFDVGRKTLRGELYS
ncbi:uncharacterized protein LAJ45_03297 [Morchella importuna]|uniref:uncharacterized protein n=1 Tax=Morchella importuna TaxID=1174673 RepID=UPI001E8DBAB3|nr:uncharacterized protein LAJ45_03297 [Morchella importuna]KAH8152457.1 hypothetical protein LAJ45_03297 [Morchella importuna]